MLSWAIGAIVGVVGFGAEQGSAFFATTDSSGVVQALDAALSAPTTPTATANDSTDITVGWTLPATQVSMARYRVTRTSGPGSGATVCSVVSTTTSCQDTGLVPGSTYAYSTMAVLPGTSWQSSAITASTSTPRVTPTITTAANPSAVTVGGSPDDQATISAGYNPTGTITWKVYASADATCTGTAFFTSSAQPVSGNSMYTSSSYTTTAAGSYKWGLVYSGDPSNNAVTDCGGASETLTVNQAAPTLGTSATSTSVGSGVTDAATLNSGYNPTGSITFTLYGPSATAVCTTAVGTVTSSVSGNGSYTSPSVTPTQAGTYWWIASYGGDSNNQAVSDACGSTGETSTVAPVTPTVVTNATPASVTVGGSVADKATISGGYNPNGTISWSLYASTDTTCTTPLFTSNGQPVTGNATYTTPNTFTTTTAGTYIWGSHYTGDTNNNPVSECGGSNETLTVNRASPTLTATGPATGITGMTIAAASISANLQNGQAPTGALAFTVFGPQSAAPTSCTSGGTTVGSGTTAGGNGTYHPSAGYSPTIAGNYWWYASYAGDGNNTSATSTCGVGMSETVVTAPSVTITSAHGDGGGDKISFTGTGITGASITVTVCDINSFPCPTSPNHVAGTVTTTVGSAGIWGPVDPTKNFTDGTQYFAQAVQSSPAGTSSVLAFTAEKNTNAAATITAPLSATCYYNVTAANCSTTPKASWASEGSKIAGTASDSGGQTLATVQVAIKTPGGMWWNGAAFASSVPVYSQATGTSAWSYAISAAQLDGNTGSLLIQVTATDTNNMTGATTSLNFTWTG